MRCNARRRRCLQLLGAVILVACKRDKAPEPQPETQPKACNLAPLPLRHQQPKRVVAIGDLHGDLSGTRAAFRAGGLIDDADHWIGKDTVVVQTGDVLDRGDDEQAILDLLFKLEGEAKAQDGELILLLGNHELMNAAGDFRYVTPGAMHDFDEVARDRIAALGPGGPYAKQLAKHDVIVIVGDTIYSHAGVIGDFVTQVDAVNMSSRCWLDGQAGGASAVPIAMSSDQSPVWTRALGLDPVDCAAAKTAMDTLGVKRMVVGHTVQEKGVNAVCDGTVWRIDVGLAKLYGGPIQVLEIVDGVPKILSGTR